MSSSLDVVIPAFNAESTISQAVHSAYATGAARVIVVDDGSTDGTSSFAEKAGAEVFHQANSGASVARRLGISMSTGDFVALLDADDALITEGVRRSIGILESDPSLVAVGGPAIGQSHQSDRIPIVPPVGRLTFLELVSQGYSPVPPACVIWRREAVASAAGDEQPPPLRPRYAEDYELLVRGTLRGDLMFHDEPAAVYRLEGGKSTVDPSRSIRASAEIRSYYASSQQIDIRPWRERHVMARTSLRLAKNTDGLARMRLMLRAAVLDPVLFGAMAAQRAGKSR